MIRVWNCLSMGTGIGEGLLNVEYCLGHWWGKRNIRVRAIFIYNWIAVSAVSVLGSERNLVLMCTWKHVAHSVILCCQVPEASLAQSH